jgi:hypothetical protein
VAHHLRDAAVDLASVHAGEADEVALEAAAALSLAGWGAWDTSDAYGAVDLFLQAAEVLAVIDGPQRCRPAEVLERTRARMAAAALGSAATGVAGTPVVDVAPLRVGSDTAADVAAVADALRGMAAGSDRGSPVEAATALLRHLG